MVMEVSAACHKNEGSREAMRRFCLLENEGKYKDETRRRVHYEEKETFVDVPWNDRGVYIIRDLIRVWTAKGESTVKYCECRQDYKQLGR